MASVKKSAQKAAIEPLPKRAITNHRVLNEAYHYTKPSSFSRGMRVDLGGGAVMLLISGTASIDEHGATVHVGDFRATRIRRCHLEGHRPHHLLPARH